MFVLARDGKSYARLRFNVGPGGQVVIPVEVDYSLPFGASDHGAWEAEYKANIKAGHWPDLPDSYWREQPETGVAECCTPDDWMEELEAMEPEERRLVMDELSARPDLWGEEMSDEF